MRARLILTTLVAIVAMAAACGDEGTPQSPTPTLREDEVWAMVQEKLVAGCPKGWMVPALRIQHESQYAEGRWDFWLMKEVEESSSARFHGLTREELLKEGYRPEFVDKLLPPQDDARLERTDVQVTVYEATGTVTGNAGGLMWLSGRPSVCH